MTARGWPAACLLALALVTAALLITACGRAGGEDNAARAAGDDAAHNQGDELRLVALSPALAVILRDLGLEERIVGRHAWDLALDPALPVCGDQTGIDYERLLRVEPTHVLLEWGARPLPPRLLDLARRHQWHVESFHLLTLDDIAATAQQLHESLISEQEWERTSLAAQLARRFVPKDAGAASIAPSGGPGNADLAAAGRVLLLYGVRPAQALGPGSAHHEILLRLGAAPALRDGGPHIVLDAEDLLTLAPDAIILIMPHPRRPRTTPASPAEIAELLGRAGRLDIPAIEHGRLALIDHPLALTPSTALIEVADEIAAILEVWSR